jgi:HEAT repeat protein
MLRIRTDVYEAIEKLHSLHDGDTGVVEIIGYGERAIPLLAAILFKPEPSGLYDTRRRAVEALAALRAYDVLRDFLRTPRDITDPVEQTGEEAVINAAARALGDLGDRQDLPLLLALLKREHLAGVIEAVGRFRPPEALPYFIEALADDFSRPAAEGAIRKLGVNARDALFQYATHRDPSSGREVDSSKQQRRSALRLLLNLGRTPRAFWSALELLIQDLDQWIAMLASRLCLGSGMDAAKPAAVARLIGLLKSADGLLAEEIADCLLSHFDLARTMIDDVIEAEERAPDAGRQWWSEDRTLPVLLRVRARHSAMANNPVTPKGRE